MNIRNLKDQPLDEIQVKKAGRQIKGFLIWLLKVVIIVGISYIILGPLITIVANSFFTANDLYNPVVMLLPAEGTLQELYYIFYKNDVPEDACDNVRLCDIADADPDLYLLHGRVWICKI